MTRRGGNRSPRFVARRKKRKVAEAAAQVGVDNVNAIVHVTGMPESTVRRYMGDLEAEVRDTPENKEKFMVGKNRSNDRLEAMRRAVIDSPDFTDESRIAALLAIEDRQMKLWGWDDQALTRQHTEDRSDEPIAFNIVLVPPQPRPEAPKPVMELPPAPQESEEISLEELRREAFPERYGND